MKRRLSPLVALIVIAVFAQNSLARDTGKADSPTVGHSSPDIVIRVGYFEFPGLTYTDSNGKPAGLVNEITMKTLENAGIKYTIASYPAARFFDYLSKGKIDLFNGLSSISVVHNSTISSKLNLFPLNMRVYSVGKKKRIHKKENLQGRSVILVLGFTYNNWGKWIRDKANGVEFYDTDTHEAAFEMLKKGRAEFLLDYKYIDEECLKNIKIPDLYIQTPPTDAWFCTFNLYKETPQARLIIQQMENSYLQLIKKGKLKKYR